MYIYIYAHIWFHVEVNLKNQSRKQKPATISPRRCIRRSISSLSLWMRRMQGLLSGKLVIRMFDIFWTNRTVLIEWRSQLFPPKKNTLFSLTTGGPYFVWVKFPLFPKKQTVHCLLQDGSLQAWCEKLCRLIRHHCPPRVCTPVWWHDLPIGVNAWRIHLSEYSVSQSQNILLHRYFKNK